MFTGLAIGGPLDGKTIQSESPYYKVAELNKLKPYVSMEKEISVALELVDVFCYEHYKTYGGDVFIPREILQGERYEHKIYEHPLDFIFSKLIRSYRPDGY